MADKGDGAGQGGPRRPVEGNSPLSGTSGGAEALCSGVSEKQFLALYRFDIRAGDRDGLAVVAGDLSDAYLDFALE